MYFVSCFSIRYSSYFAYYKRLFEFIISLRIDERRFGLSNSYIKTEQNYYVISLMSY